MTVLNNMLAIDVRYVKLFLKTSVRVGMQRYSQLCSGLGVYVEEYFVEYSCS